MRAHVSKGILNLYVLRYRVLNFIENGSLLGQSAIRDHTSTHLQYAEFVKMLKHFNYIFRLLMVERVFYWQMMTSRSSSHSKQSQLYIFYPSSSK